MDPVSKFQKEYKKRFHAYVEDFLARAVKKSQIDLRENAQLAHAIRHNEHVLQRKLSSRGWLRFFLFILIAIAVAGAVYLYIREFPQEILAYYILYLVFGGGLLFFKVIPDLRHVGEQIEKLKLHIKALTDEALEKLLPFYRQFSWNTLTKLIERVLPEISFDDYLSHSRMQELRKQYHLDFQELMQNRSMLYTHSGTFYGYPFLFFNTKDFYWGEETYTGTKRITWTTRERGPDGKMQTRFHSQTLFASVTKPCPRFFEQKRLLFAHPAAPNLSFSRKPSEFSGETGFWAGVKRRSQLKKLKRFEANLTDESNYTMVANEAFEVLFNTANRDHEVEFRVLFPPSAQQQMVTLLNDKLVGYGDDITYIKAKTITMLHPEHLNHLPFSTEPTVLPYYDFNEVLKHYRTHYAEFFRSIYFAFAPLYTIPAYHEPAPEEEASRGNPGISAWEMEAIANWQGEAAYAHPACDTECLLCVDDIEQHDSGATATVTARGFAGVKQIDYVQVFGNDGNLHSVAVPWVDYHEVAQRSTLTVYSDTAHLVDRGGLTHRRTLAVSEPV